MNEVFPFAACVGQDELKSALLLAMVNPAVGGVLLQGPYGVGTTTLVRSLLDLLPPLQPLGQAERLHRGRVQSTASRQARSASRVASRWCAKRLCG